MCVTWLFSHTFHIVTRFRQRMIQMIRNFYTVYECWHCGTVLMLLFMNCEGDGNWVLQIILLFFKSQVKEAILLPLHYYYLFIECQAKQLKWHQLPNPKGRVGCNISCNFCFCKFVTFVTLVEHSYQVKRNGHLTFQCVIDCWGTHLAFFSYNVVATHGSLVMIVLS